jgi:hypothetical protein
MPSPDNAPERFRLDFCHSSLDARDSGFAIDGEYLRQRRSTDKDCNWLAPEFRLKTNDGLHRKIWNE